MLPTSVAIVSAAFPPEQRGRALGTMGGAAAVAGALGPTIGGVLTSALSWRAVLLVNAPLAIACVAVALRSVAADPPRTGRVRVDVGGAVLICLALVGLSFGFSQTQLGLELARGARPARRRRARRDRFVPRAPRRRPAHGHRAAASHRNYLGATISQGVAGIAEMGLGAHLPAAAHPEPGHGPGAGGPGAHPDDAAHDHHQPARRTVVRPVGRPAAAHHRLRRARPVGPRPGWGVAEADYLRAAARPAAVRRRPGARAHGERPGEPRHHPGDEQGQASGVSATAEQGLGRSGSRCCTRCSTAPTFAAARDRGHRAAAGPDDTAVRGAAGRHPGRRVHGTPSGALRSSLVQYLFPAKTAAEHGYSITFIAVSVVAAIGLAAVTVLVRKPASAT